MHAGKNEQKYYFSFLVAAMLLLLTHREGCAEKNKIGFCFLFDTGTQSIAVSVTRYVLLLFLTAPGSCCRPPCRPAFMCVSCYLQNDKKIMLNLTSAAAAAAAAAANALRTAGWSCSVFFSFSFNSLAKATW